MLQYKYVRIPRYVFTIIIKIPRKKSFLIFCPLYAFGTASPVCLCVCKVLEPKGLCTLYPPSKLMNLFHRSLKQFVNLSCCFCLEDIRPMAGRRQAITVEWMTYRQTDRQTDRQKMSRPDRFFKDLIIWGCESIPKLVVVTLCVIRTYHHFWFLF